jgi:DNA-binding phage protein
MAQQRTAFDDFFDQQMRNPEVASAYAEARAEVDQVDQFMRALEAARTASGLSKAELARLSKMPAAGVRRVLSSEDANPTIATVLSILRTMGLGLQIVPTEKSRGSKGREASRLGRHGKGKGLRGVAVRKQGTARTKAKGRGGQVPAPARG